MDGLSLDSAVSFDWFILLLRIAFIALIYLFLFQVSRVSLRELIALGSSPGQRDSQTLPDPSSALEVVDSGESSLSPGSLLPLDHYTTVGRIGSNSLVLDDGFVSGSHAEIMFDQGAWWVVDLDSTNGTFVNGRPVHTRMPIANGDSVQFGRISLRARV
ncbi:MAG TPA: FHA domain-containing protein [Thermomicrobiales bacterium]|nr:FHA domain-containing protein [Thermomicrobiales bacterium]